MSLSTTFRAWFLKPVTDKLTELGHKVADITNVLADVANELNSNVFPAVGALLQRIADLEAQLAAQGAEEASESTAAADVVAATKKVSDLFAGTPEVPDVPPVTEPAPVEGAPTDNAE